jgi:hypothetical protein
LAGHERAAAKIEDMMGRKLNVLVVEDEELDALLVVRQIKNAGYDVASERVETGGEMKAALARQDWDVVISDYSLPQFDAPSALRLLQEAGLDLPFIVVSGTIGEDVAVAMMKVGAHDYLVKGHLARLVPTIEREMEQARIRRDRKRAEEALRDAQERLERAVSAGNVGLWDWDLRTNRMYYSPECKRQLGYEDNDIGDYFDEWVERIHPDDRERVLQTVERCIHDRGAEFAQEFRARHKDGSYRWILTQGSPILDAQGQPVRMLGAHLDVTGRKQLEEQFLEAQKMESVGRLAGGVAHDFNNLLSVINGYADFALDALPVENTLREDIQEIRNAGDKAVALTQQLLAFSRRQVFQTEILNLNWIVAESEKILRRVIGEDVELSVVPDEDLGNVKADPGKIEQVIFNLAVNARDAMPAGGELTIETRNVELDETYAASHLTVQPGPYVQLTVSDTGMGMDEATLGRVFEPFFTTKEMGKGTGLGLATVYGIVKQSDGSIWVYSEVGRGTTFKILLPRVDDETDGRPPTHREGPSLGTETILLVEDDQSLRALAERILTGAGYTVLASANGAEAAALLEKHPGVIHLLLSDVVMPGGNGRELADRLTNMQPELKVLFMSGYTDDAIVHHRILENMAPFIPKPFTAFALLRKVREVLDASRE